MTRLALVSTVAVAAVAVALAGCTSGGDDVPAAADRPSATSSTTPTPTTTPTPPPEAPAVGACYRITFDEAVALSNEDPSVGCAKAHTSQTYAIGRLDDTAAGHLLAVDSARVRSQVARQCPRKLAAYVGATPEQLRLSLLRPIWFTPTLEQGDAGATWFRCDVIAVTGDAGVARLDGDLAGGLASPDARTAYAMCGTAQPGTPEFSHVLCGDDHSWKAITVVDLADTALKGGGFPGVKAVREAGEDGTCADAARAIASDALDYEWGYEWPTKDQWQAGQTYGRCWSPDPA